MARYNFTMTEMYETEFEIEVPDDINEVDDYIWHHPEESNEVGRTLLESDPSTIEVL